MSHFAVLVIGDDVTNQLQPFHEFECTGQNDQYVQNINRVEEARNEYETSTTTMMKTPDGEYMSPVDDCFYRDPTPEEKDKIGIGGMGFTDGIQFMSKDWGDGQGYRPKVHFIPEGHEEVQVPHSELRTFAQFIEYWDDKERLGPDDQADLEGKHRFGWYRVDDNGEVIEVMDRTNPNAKWDWWVVGGRWTGYFKLKNPTSDTAYIGEGGLFSPSPKPGYADSALKGEIDVEAMRDEAGLEAEKLWDQIREITQGHPWTSFAELRERHDDDIEAARASYHSQDAIKRIRESRDIGLIFDLDRFLVTKAEYIQRARNAAGVPFAVLMDGEWYQKGEMGWWGIVAGEQDQEEWNQKVAELLDELPADTRITAVDCHI